MRASCSCVSSLKKAVARRSAIEPGAAGAIWGEFKRTIYRNRLRSEAPVGVAFPADGVAEFSQLVVLHVNRVLFSGVDAAAHLVAVIGEAFLDDRNEID